MNRKEYQPLTLPRLSWNKANLTQTYGELVAQPLEPGFGITLGNALRRILLGGVEGSAVTAVIIKGINNEFSVLPGVVEDAMQVILNIKEIVVHNKTGKPGKMRLVVKGEAQARVGDIQADDHLEVLNRDHVLAQVAPAGTLDIEFFVEPGRGYRQAQWPLNVALQEDNRIYLDAMFSPVRKVTYDVTKTRVGRDIDYDKLMLAIQTDGTESPVDAVNYAVSILRTQFEHFLVQEEIPFNQISQPVIDEKKQEPVEQTTPALQGASADILLKPIDILEVSVRAHNCLVNAGIKRIIDLVNMPEDEVLKIKNFGRKSFDEVKEVMKSFGLTFDMNIKESDLKNMQERE